MQRGQRVGLLEDEAHVLVEQQRPQHAPEGREEIAHLELGRAHHDLARLHLGQIQEVVHQLGEVLGGAADVADLPLLLRAERPLGVLQEQPRERQHRVERGAELVTHVGEEARLHLVRATQRVRLLVQLRVEGQDPAVGILQLRVEPGQVLLALAQLLQRAQELLVLLPHLLEGALGGLARQGVGQRAHVLGAQRRRAAREQLAEPDGGPHPGAALHLEVIDQAPGPEHAEAHPGRGPVAPGQHALEVRDAAPDVAHLHQQELGGVPPLHRDLHLAAARVHERVAGDLGHRGGDPGLVLDLEAQTGGDLTRPLARGHHVGLLADEERDEGQAHGCLRRAATTVTSSRPRLQSR